MSTHMSRHMSRHMSTHMPVHMPTHMSIHMSMHMSIPIVYALSNDLDEPKIVGNAHLNAWFKHSSVNTSMRMSTHTDNRSGATYQ